MSTKQIILVTGATGAQGGSVVKHLLNQGKFAVRAMTRDASSASAKALEAAGATVIEADMNSVASLKKAMEGVYGVFAVTNYREHFENEFELGLNLLKAVSKSTIQHLVMTTAPNAALISKGRLPVPELDQKAELEAEARRLSLNATFIHLSFYYEDFVNFTPFEKSADGHYYFGFPLGSTKLASISVADLGGIVAKVFNHPMLFIGRILGAVGEDRTGDQYAEIMSNSFNKSIRYKHIPHEIFSGFDFLHAQETANMFEFYRLYVHNRQPDLDESRKLYPGIQSFATWLNKNVAKFDDVFAGEKEEIFA